MQQPCPNPAPNASARTSPGEALMANLSSLPLKLQRLALSGALMLLACAEHDVATAPIAPAQLSIASAVSADTGIRDWNALSDSALWRYIATSDSSATVGLRTPGAAHGFAKGRVLIDRQSWETAKASLRRFPGATVIAEDSLIPWVRLRIKSAAVLSTVRALPFIEYVEPTYIVQRVPFWASWGCDYQAYTGSYTYTSSGDILPYIYRDMLIDRAWAYSTGSGVTIGLTDTGADEQQYELGTGFSSGESQPRVIRRFQTEGSSSQVNPPCSHGTRMAGVLAAPSNGNSVIGVAWRSDLVSTMQASRLLDVDSYDAQQAIRDAAVAGSTVILMAWQSH